MLQCVRCKAAVAVIIHPKLTSSHSIRKLITTYQGKLANAHALSCPFRLDAEQHFQNTNDNTQPSQVVPPLMAAILPQNLWMMVESPSPLALLKERFEILMEQLVVTKDAKDMMEGTPPQWEFPPLVLPKDILQFDGRAADSVAAAASPKENTEELPKKNRSRKRRLLARLAFDPKHPETAIGFEPETMLSKLEKLLLPPEDEQEEIRAQTRALGAWEDFYEVIVALALFGWVPATTTTTGIQSNTTTESDPVVNLECPVCLSRMNFQMHEYDWHHHQHGTSPKKKVVYGSDSEEGGPPRKRQRLQQQQYFSTNINPVLSHRHYCPYVCGFPRDGARKGTPLWKTIAKKMLHKNEPKQNGADENSAADGDAAMDRILQLLDAGVSTHVHASS